MDRNKGHQGKQGNDGNLKTFKSWNNRRKLKNNYNSSHHEYKRESNKVK